MRRSWFAFAGVGLVASFLVAACREPTAIVLEITTDVPCADVGTAGGVDIRIGTTDSVETAPSTHVQATACSGKTIGTLTITPSGSNDDPVAVFVAVATKANASLDQGLSTECSSDAIGNCVIARRILRYVPHATLHLPIHLGLACAGATCADGETCDPVDGLCHPTDRCIADPQSCMEPVDAGVSDGGACAKCGGNDCVDFTTDPKNCGGCKSPCNGTCIAGACRLVVESSPIPTQGCLAVESGAVLYTNGSGAVGTLAWTSNTGLAKAVPLVANGSFGYVHGGASNAVSVGRLPPPQSTSVDYGGNPPMAMELPWQLPPPQAHVAIARSKNGVRCATFSDANGVYSVGCPPKFSTMVSNGSTPRKLGPIAVGKDYWAVIADPETPTSQVMVGDFTGKVVIAPTLATSVPLARAITAVPGTNDFYVANDKNVTYVGLDPNGTGLVISAAFTSAAPVLAVRTDGGPIYFVDQPAGAPRLRRFKWSIGTPTVQTANLLAQAPFTRLGSTVCIDTDSLGVYFLADGVPYRRPL